MIVARSGSLMPPHAAISARVRPQPTQSADMGSTTQTFTQGVMISEADMGSHLGSGLLDEKAAPGADLRPLLRGAGDVAGLATDLP